LLNKYCICNIVQSIGRWRNPIVVEPNMEGQSTTKYNHLHLVIH
jgi:hypothetical protein